ncbi:hypothetical protein [Dyadobacter sp. BHUBP1]|uniref:hypothetical protein n=1 Tax=Dyadobacter sp. BHUBP1 TaxID=3424178 RepID=UPI003D34537B
MKWVILGALTVWISGCSETGRSRPITVPETAVWKGGPDGGVWVEFVSVTSTTINANIFSENGQIWERGLFKKKGSCDIAKSEVEDAIVGFDGNRLLTYKHCSFEINKTAN